jgi:tryptophanyl-tRNA synthetase
MAADILMFNAHRVPVGRDQVQHIEMARDLAQRFNHLFGAGRELFVLPEANIDERVAMLPGLDGRKMSKSYDNTVPLFEGGAKGLRDALARVVTDSRAPGEGKEPEGSHLVAIYEAFANDAERAKLRADLRAGLAWGDAKAVVVERIERDIGPMRERYADLIAHPERIEEILLEGARKARAVAAPFLATLREAVGLRRMVAVTAPASSTAAKVKAALPTFKQYRETDGKFYFKLAAADGRLLLQSAAFDSGRDAGQWVSRLKTDGASALGDAPVIRGDGVSAQDVSDALAALAAQ